MVDKLPVRRRLKIAFILAKSFTLSAFAMFVDTIRLASDELDRSGRIHADWQILSDSREPIISSCGARLSPTSALVDPSEFDYIVVVGGLLGSEIAVDYSIMEYLKSAAEKNTPIIGICTGTFILAEAGLLNNHLCCVSWLHYDEFRGRYPHLKVRSDRIFSLDPTRGSCAGGSSAADMAAYLVRRHISKDAERNALEVLQIERARSGQAVQPRRPLGIETADSRLRAALVIMERHLEERVSISKLAQRVGVSRRQLERLFTNKIHSSPAQVYKLVRLERAKYLLRQTEAPLIDIAIESGFENSSHFARVFREVVGQSPTKWRNLDPSSVTAELSDML